LQTQGGNHERNQELNRELQGKANRKNTITESIQRRKKFPKVFIGGDPGPGKQEADQRGDQ
jgi:hypothetical protein